MILRRRMMAVSMRPVWNLPQHNLIYKGFCSAGRKLLI
jgi:hypothetical protein